MAKINNTLPSKLVGVYRIALGLLFLATGLLKIFNKNFAAIWSTQLKEIRIPFYTAFYHGVPVYEIILGSLLFIGYYSRVGAILILPLMVVAIYTHMTVYNPEAFMLQPYEATYPGLILMFASTVLVYGGGSWSLDLKIQRKVDEF